MNRYLYLLIILIAFFSCKDNYMVESEGEKLVVEGWIADGGYPVVMLMTSAEVEMKTRDIKDLYEHIGSWGRVVVSDGEKSVILTGMYDTDYYPPYVYTTTDIKGVAGKTYTLDVVYNKHHAMAVTTICGPSGKMLL